jgi:bile acid:Na+ symporter, BASS family
MGGMGLTLELSDFALAVSKPWIVLIGVLAQYGIMPSLGFVLGRVLKLRPELAVGLILVSVCPGGAASNIVCLIGKADVALSVVLTLCSTVRVVPHRVLCDLFARALAF